MSGGEGVRPYIEICLSFNAVAFNLNSFCPHLWKDVKGPDTCDTVAM